MNDRPDVTVFTPVFNRKHTIDRPFDSLMRQTCKDFEWLVIDDGSTDGIKETIDIFAEKADFSVRYSFKENGGKHTAMNMAAGLARGGYFLVLDSDDINAFATPGGHVFITRGLIRCCRTEDALAAVLAHEIGHVQLRHGMKAIEKARMTEAFTVLAQEGAKSLGSQEVAQLTQAFGGVISDITNTMINNGYSRSYEYQADAASLSILKRLGYNPGALIDMLGVMDKKIKPGGSDFAKTHPSPQNRIAELKDNEKSLVGGEPPAARKERFTKAVGHLLR